MDLSGVSIWAVLASTIVGMAIGALWYSPVLFANPWMEALGKKPEEMGDPMKAMAAMPFNVIATAIILALLMSSLNLSGVISGIVLGTIVWIGFALTSHVNLLLFEGRKPILFLINIGHLWATYVLMGIVIGLLQV